jgi:hypothetical protein
MATQAPVPFVDNPSASLGPSGDGWDAAGSSSQPPAAAQPSTPAQPGSSAQPGVAPTETPGSGKVASEQAPAYTAPPLVTSQKRGGILGVVDDIANALTGKTAPEIGTDEQGNKYVKQNNLSRGQQWVRIDAGLLGGAAKGMAAGKGRNPGAAAAAGFDQGQQMRQQEQDAQTQASDQAMKQNLANANYQKLRMDAAEQAWHLTAMQHEATQNDVTFAQGQEDRLRKVDGATLLGTASDPNDIDKILKVNPDVMKDMIQNHQIEILPHYNEDGSRGGIRVFKMPDGYRSAILPAGTTFHTFDSTTGQYVPHQTSEPITAGEVDDYDTAAGNAANKFKLDQAKLAQTQAQANEANANATKVPSEISENRARTTQAYAGAAKDMEDVKTAKGKEAQASDPQLVDSIASGKIVPERMSYLLARNPQLLDAVAAKDPSFDGSKAESYPVIYKDFTSGKAATAINSGATAMEHMQKLQRLNTAASHIPGTAAYNAYHNQLDTLAPELAKFYGDTTVPAIAALKSTLGATLPGNRQAAIETQAQSMGKKFDNYEQQWTNAAPSRSYEAPMPGLSEEAKEARAALDPSYRARLVSEKQGAPRASNAVQPGEQTALAADGKTTLVVRNGQWVPAQQ